MSVNFNAAAISPLEYLRPPVQIDQSKNSADTIESKQLSHGSGLGGFCCTNLSVEEAGQAVSRTGELDAHGFWEWHVPEGFEAGLAGGVGYIAAGGAIAAANYAKDNHEKAKGLQRAKDKLEKFNPDNAKSNNKEQAIAKESLMQVLDDRIKRAKFERDVNGCVSAATSTAVTAGFFWAPLQYLGLVSLAGGCFANMRQSLGERRYCLDGIKRAQWARIQSKYDAKTDDTAIRERALSEKKKIVSGNAFYMGLLGTGALVNLGMGIAQQVVTGGLSLTPVAGSLISLTPIAVGVCGTLYENNRKNGDAHGVALSHELGQLVNHLDQEGNGALPDHAHIRKLNIEADRQFQICDKYRALVYEYRGRKSDGTGRSWMMRMISFEHGALRYLHKIATLLTMGLSQKVRDIKDGMRDYILRHNKGEKIERARVATLNTLNKSGGKLNVDNFCASKTKDKIATLLNLIENSPLAPRVHKKFLSRITEVDKKRGIYVDPGSENGDEAKKHSYLRLKSSFLNKAISSNNLPVAQKIVNSAIDKEVDRLERAATFLRNNKEQEASSLIGDELCKFGSDTLQQAAKELKCKNMKTAAELLGTKKMDRLTRCIQDNNVVEAARIIVSNEATSLFSQPDGDGEIICNAFDVIRSLLEFNPSQSFSEEILRELNLSVDHILMFTAIKDARRAMVTYSQVSDAFEKVKQERELNDEFFDLNDKVTEINDSDSDNALDAIVSDRKNKGPHVKEDDCECCPAPLLSKKKEPKHAEFAPSLDEVRAESLPTVMPEINHHVTFSVRTSDESTNNLMKYPRRPKKKSYLSACECCPPSLPMNSSHYTTDNTHGNSIQTNKALKERNTVSNDSHHGVRDSERPSTLEGTEGKSSEDSATLADKPEEQNAMFSMDAGLPVRPRRKKRVNKPCLDPCCAPNTMRQPPKMLFDPSIFTGIPIQCFPIKNENTPEESAEKEALAIQDISENTDNKENERGSLTGKVLNNVVPFDATHISIDRMLGSVKRHKTPVVGSNPNKEEQALAIMEHASRAEHEHHVFQFVSKSRQINPDKRGQTITGIVERLERENTESAPWGGDTKITGIESLNTNNPDVESLRIKLQRDNIDGQSHDSSIVISLAGYDFHDGVLSKNDLISAYHAYKIHHLADGEQTAAPTPIFLSKSGIGRSAALMVLNELMNRHSTKAFHSNTDLEEQAMRIVKSGRQVRGKNFIHSAKQYQVVINAAKELMGMTA